MKNVADYKDIIPVAQSFGLNHEVFKSWIETLVYVRNICAHHARMWNIILTINPTWPNSTNKSWVNRWENISGNDATNDKVLKIYAVFCMITYIHSQINPYSTFKDRLRSLLNDYDDIDLKFMGFPDNWKDEALWM